jgi:hypothetical protein
MYLQQLIDFVALLFQHSQPLEHPFLLHRFKTVYKYNYRKLKLEYLLRLSMT